MKIWAYLYNSCIYESAASTESLHLTKEGAEKAMQDAKDLQHEQWKENMTYYSDPINGLLDLVEQQYVPCNYQEHYIQEVEVYE